MNCFTGGNGQCLSIMAISPHKPRGPLKRQRYKTRTGTHCETIGAREGAVEERLAKPRCATCCEVEGSRRGFFEADVLSVDVCLMMFHGRELSQECGDGHWSAWVGCLAASKLGPIYPAPAGCQPRDLSPEVTPSWCVYEHHFVYFTCHKEQEHYSL
jgi:hypothetical protein